MHCLTINMNMYLRHVILWQLIYSFLQEHEAKNKRKEGKKEWEDRNERRKEKQHIGGGVYWDKC